MKLLKIIDFILFVQICLQCLGLLLVHLFINLSFSSKNWGPFIIAQSFMAYSILSVITLFLSGFLIDKFTSRKLLLYMNIPLLISVIVIIYFNHPITSFIFLG